MARPRYLPVFNPNIPKVLRTEWPLLAIEAEKCVRKTQNKTKNAGLLWLSLYSKTIRHIIKFKMVEGNHNLTPAEADALRWIRHKGKWNWEVPDDTIGRPNTNGA